MLASTAGGPGVRWGVVIFSGSTCASFHTLNVTESRCPATPTAFFQLLDYSRPFHVATICMLRCTLWHHAWPHLFTRV